MTKNLVYNYYLNMYFQSIENIVNIFISLNRESTIYTNTFQQIKTLKQHIETLENYTDKRNW